MWIVEVSLEVMMLDVISWLEPGAAAGGHLTRWSGAQPCSSTCAPVLPARAAVGAYGSGDSWPRQLVRRPLPREPWCVQRMRRETGTFLTALTGRCRCHHTADASSLEAVGRAGFERFGIRWLGLTAVALASIGSEKRMRAETPLAPFSGCRGLDRAADASVVEAVGHIGVGLLGVRW